MGRWKKGECGNPGGRPVLPPDLKIMCQGRAEEAIRVAVEILSDTQQPGATRLKAAEVILDRAYGRPAQTIQGDGENPLTVTLVEIIKSVGNAG